jgi:hypothetical protein
MGEQPLLSGVRTIRPCWRCPNCCISRQVGYPDPVAGLDGAVDWVVALTNQQRSPAAWTAYHLYLPETQEGVILALRRARSDVRTMTFDLLTIDPANRWKFEDYDSGRTWVVSGQEIREKGFEIVIPNRRDSRLIFYSANQPSS